MIATTTGNTIGAVILVAAFIAGIWFLVHRFRNRGIRQLERQAKEAAKGLRFAGITVVNGMVTSPDGGGPLEGARASIDTAGDIDRRVTGTRLLLTGPFAFGLRKKKDNRELFVVIEGQGWGIVRSVAPTKGLEARRFVTAINAAAGRPLTIETPKP